METVKISPKWSNRTINLKCRGGSDADVIKEVIERRCYRRPSIGFEILPGEHWLDLGANMGTFAAYCHLSDATATCYEPEPDNFAVLKENVGKLVNPGSHKSLSFHLVNAAVTTVRSKTLQAVKSNNLEDFYRLTFSDNVPARYLPAGEFPNVHVSTLKSPKGKLWDGVKMDIEGSELPMIDEGVLPPTNKLVMEYHFSRDKGSMKNFHSRMSKLRKLFDTVKYPPSLDRVPKGEVYPGRFDIIVFCLNRSE